MKKIIFSIVVLCLFVILYLNTNIFNRKSLDKRPCTEIVFNSQLWKDSFLLRGRMVNNLIESKRLSSLERDSIEKLLGKPTEDTSYMMDYLVDMKCGNEKFGKMLLYIEIDSVKNRVTDYWLTD